MAYKAKVDPKLCRHRTLQYSQRLAVSAKFYGVVNREISIQLIANIFAEWFQMGAVAYFEFKIHEIVSCLQISSTVSTWSWYAVPLHAFKINSWKFLYSRLLGWLNKKRPAFGERLTFPSLRALQHTNQNAKPFPVYWSHLRRSDADQVAWNDLFSITFFPNCLRGNVMILADRLHLA